MVAIDHFAEHLGHSLRSNFKCRQWPPGFVPFPVAISLTDVVMSLERLSDESIMRMYECIRDQLAADTRTPRPLMGQSAKRRAEQLAAEMHRRRMRFAMIEWPSR